jgi:hypothetical protein
MNRFLLYSSKYIFISALFLTSVISDAQTDREVGTGLDPIVTVGVQFNTIFASNLFRARTTTGNSGDVTFNLIPQNGYSFGALAKLRITKQLYMHTGINMLRRNFRVEAIVEDNISSMTIRTTMYEIPVMITYYLRMSERYFLSLSTGFPIQYVPTDLLSGTTEMDALSLKVAAFRPASATLVGVDYRTPNDGTFYLGAIYNIALTHQMLTRVTLRNGASPEPFIDLPLKGDYFGLVLRYYFN